MTVPLAHIDVSVSGSPTGLHISSRKIQQITQTICQLLRLGACHVSIAFVSAPAIASLNRRFRGKRSATDVLSFPQAQWDRPMKPPTPRALTLLMGIPPVLGDIVICLRKAQANAKAIGQSIDREVCFLLVHGILHLCGYDHMESKSEALMLRKQRSLMRHLETLWPRCVTASGARQ